jgi:hypothetical protein
VPAHPSAGDIAHAGCFACCSAPVVAELGMLAGFLYLPPLADLLDQAPPSLAGLAVALVAIPAVLAAHALHKPAR